MSTKRKRCVPACLIFLFMLCVMLPAAALAMEHSTAVSADAAWNDNDTVSALTISGGTAEEPIVITVTGTVTVNGMITIGPGTHVKFTGGGTLLRGAGYLDSLIEVSEGMLTLENVVLDGNKDNVSAEMALVNIISNGSMTMNDGAVLRNNRNTTRLPTYTGGGVRLYSNTGALVMNGGSITGNESACDGGGIHVHARNTVKSTFVMNGGSIAGNSAIIGYPDNPYAESGKGGGVSLFHNATFVMHGGTISGNSAEVAGSAIYGANGSAGPSTLTISPQADVAIAGSIVGESIVPVAVTPADGYPIVSVTVDGVLQSAASGGSYSIGTVAGSLEIVLARDNPPVAGEPWDGETSTQVEETDAAGNAGSGYYRISTGAQLAWLAQQVNAGQSFSGKTVLLTHDI
ncbi:MAG TPA: hypothetical protein DCZ10_12020, partial [Pelotomaculum sp.]|nr:hypothetical protein [Pelotomaculum sp.]